MKKKKSASRMRSSTTPLNPYVTRQLEIYGGGVTLSGFQRLRAAVPRFFRNRIKQPLIAVLALGFGFTLTYGVINLRSNGPMRQQTMGLVKQYSLDSPVTHIKNLGNMVQASAEQAVLIDAMERTRVMLEAYPVEGGTYPPNVNSLYERAKQEGYWALNKNPFTNARTQKGLIRDFSDYSGSAKPGDFAGMILYEPMGSYDYRIYACDKKGQLIQKNNKALSLSRP